MYISMSIMALFVTKAGREQYQLERGLDAGLRLVADMNSTRQYKCPNCKHSISITRADFIKGIAVTSCGGCGKEAFAIEESLLR